MMFDQRRFSTLTKQRETSYNDHVYWFCIPFVNGNLLNNKNILNNVNEINSVEPIDKNTQLRD